MLQATTFTLIDKNLYVPVVTPSTQDNSELLWQLKLGFKRTIKWNKYLSKIPLEAQNWFQNFFISPSFQGVNRLFLISHEDNANGTSYKRYNLPTVEIKD